MRKYLLAMTAACACTGAWAEISFENIDQAAAEVQPQVVEWRRWFHQNPELSNREFKTSARIVEILAEMGLQPKTGIAHTGVVAMIEGGKPGPLVAIRADIATTAALRMLYPTLAVLPLLALIIWWAVGRVLAPLSGLARTLALREPAALEPLATDGLPQEVGLLADALNDLVARQRELLARQQEFMADAAHELRTPLTALRLQLQLLERAPDTSSRDASLSELRRGIERSSVLIERLLSVARLDAQAVETQQPVDLAEVLRRAANEVTMLAQARQAFVEVVAEGPMQVAGDERSLLALVVNLLENALRHGPEGGRVHATLERARHAVRLVVMDQGPGIPLAERSRVFERFHRVPGTTTPGSGLGLAIVRRVADLHGATVRIDDAPGGGTLVEVDFPPAEEDRA